MNLLNLTNQEFEQSFVHVVRQERKCLHQVLEHIREASLRKFYLEKDRSSLHDYLTKDLGYSSSSAQRRIEGARLLEEIPQIASRIENGKLNLSQVCEIARAARTMSEKISIEEKLELINAIECKTTFETQLIVAQALDLPVQIPEFKRVQKDESVRIELTLTKAQYEKLQICRNLASHKLLTESALNLSDVIEFLCDQYSENPKPKGNQNSKTRVAVAINTHAASVIQCVKPENLRKCVTPKIRKEIRRRYKSCQHKDSVTHKICGSTFLLQVDHIQPRWAGGNHQDENLTLLCANHNQRKYQKEASLVFR